MQAHNSLKLFFFLVCLGLFFLPLPEVLNQQVIKEFLNLGHVVIFFLLGLFFLDCSFVKKRSSASRAIALLLATVLIGGAVELVQLQIASRYGNAQDLVKDLLGSGLAYLYVLYRELIEKRKSLLVLVFGGILIVFSLMPLANLILRRHHSVNQFPVLADFETIFEMDDWSGTAKIWRCKKHVRKGEFSGEVVFTTDKYSWISLGDFPMDWRGKRALNFSVFLELPRLVLHYKVQDEYHDQNGMRYQDRFNGRITLLSGWNEVSVSLVRVKEGPSERELDLSRVTGLSFFVVGQKTARVLHFDNIRLIN